MADITKIKKIKLSDGSIYSIFDEGALRLNDNGVLVTGNTVVDEVILQGTLYITEIDDVPVSTAIDNVLVAQNVGTSAAPVYQVQKRTTDKLLEDIGGVSYAMNDDTKILAFKFGKQ